MAPLPSREEVDAAWAWLSVALPGRWIADVPGGAMTLEIQRISGGSALLETFTTARGGRTVTVLHRDGAGLIATHYCAQGNQPRLRVVAASATRVVLERFDATDLDADEGVLERLVIEREADTGQLIQTEVYRDGTTRLALRAG